MVQVRRYMVDVTSRTNQALTIFGEWLKMCVVYYCYDKKLHLYDSPILAVFFYHCVQFA